MSKKTSVKEATVKVDFRKITVADLAGKQTVYDISKQFGNYLYKTTADLGVFDLAQRIYKLGEVDLSKSEVDLLTKILEDPNSPYLVMVRNEVLRMLKN